MSTDLTVRYSDVMQAERDFNNLTRSSTTSPDYSDSTLSVRDARKRFEQMSSSTVAAPSYKRNEGITSKEAPPAYKVRPPPPPPPNPLKKRLSEPVIRSQSTCSSPRVQSSSNQSAIAAKETDSSDVGGSPKTKAKSSKPFLKKAHSVRPGDLASTTSSEANSSSSDKLSSSATKKLFKRMSSDKGKMDSTSDPAASNGSAKGRTSKNGEASQNSPTSTSSPTHKKFTSPLSLKKKRPSASSSNSSQPSPLADKPATPKRSFSTTVLASTEERSVQASLKEDDGGKVVGGSKPTAPRVIQDGELKLNLTEGKTVGRYSVAAWILLHGYTAQFTV